MMPVGPIEKMPIRFRSKEHHIAFSVHWHMMRALAAWN